MWHKALLEDAVAIYQAEAGEEKDELCRCSSKMEVP